MLYSPSMPTAVISNAVISNKGLRRVQKGHPWVFESDIKHTDIDQAGVIALLDAEGKILGQGLYNPLSKIAIRLMTSGQVIDEALVNKRTQAALFYRERVTNGWEAFRVIHSESDGIPGLTVDKYGEYLVLQQHSAALEPFMPVILETLKAHYHPKGILARNDSEIRKLEGLTQEVKVLFGEVPEEIAFKEGDITVVATPYTGQKTGAFLDQRENHVYAGSLSLGRALDVFSYHGGFALQLAKTAQSVIAVDGSAAALSHVQKAAELNKLKNLQTLKGDAFEVLRDFVKKGERFDTIVLDPPAFAKGRTQLENAIAGYKDINIQALKLLNPGGRLITASCSYHLEEPMFYAMLLDAASDAGKQLRVLARRGQAACHPERFSMPETRYLKLAVLEVIDV
jgi:23S rRNA (cytosine1962-C5)-methyltransferase